MEYVYILTNSEFSGKIKIGKTDKHPEIRTEQLNRQTGTIGKYKCEWFAEVECSEIIEKNAHYFMKEFHYDKEFFNSSVIQNLKQI
ncbi:MAG: hypothetical protein A2033_18645 [Bacteroidetes bacterium GWA2_31_9]|nr:MAG: hypothetical protein A2033_18645 [Bacteroidetes bacterium GWA2_31_9]